MRWLILLLTMTAFQVQARVELQSVYFIGTSIELTEYSSFILQRLKSSFDNGDYQIIEINGYSSKGYSPDENVSIAEKRITTVFQELGAESANVTINAYGNQRIPLNFEPVHWNRVDLYYTVRQRWKEQQIKTDSVIEMATDTLFTLIHTPSLDGNLVASFMEIPELEKIPSDKAVPLPLFFEGNKVVMKRTSLSVLDQLYRTLIAYPELSLHIRGHVCCSKNKRISSKRARYVYAYLRKRGVTKDRLSYKGYSNSIPVVYPERTEADRSQNRRVDVIYSK